MLRAGLGPFLVVQGRAHAGSNGAGLMPTHLTWAKIFRIHATTPRSRYGCRGASSLPHRGGVRRTEVPVEVAAPLSATLDGDAGVLT
jgi:hypothetical protein